jgi:hypothetical protein
MFWCDKCKIWEHEKCLTDAIRKAYIKAHPPLTGGKRARKSFGKNIKITIATKPETGEVTATIDDGDHKIKSEPGESASNVKPESHGQGTRAATKDLPVNCLKCESRLK